ncbi:MAG: acetamidase/formamidase family protein [Chloroflexota bacterium]|nr:acetamidase/formamidase family protein [Chloroflexota bacterium]
MKELKLGKLYYEISRHNPPAITIKSGETVSVETEDAFSGQVRKEGDRRDNKVMPYGNPQSGPIYVEGAAPGDTLAVDIHKIEARIGQAATRTGGANLVGEFLGTDVPHGTRICPVRDGVIWWSPKVAIPYEPLIGTIGAAPEMGVPTTGPAGPWGGNMDIKEVTAGNTLYLPVFVPGALLHLGDAHAAQGHGELCTTAFEMPATIIITVRLLKGKSIPRPRIESRDEIMAVATGTPMERSIARAFADLMLWMEEEYGVPRWEGFNLCTQVGAISVGYYAIGTVAAKIRKEYARAAGSKG